MSAFSRPMASIGVSESIRNPLREIARRQWFVNTAVAVLQTLTFALIPLLAGALLLGYFEKMPRVLRVPLALGTWMAIAWIAIRFLPAMLRRWSLTKSATHVESALPEMHERLTSAVELAAETDDRFRGSPVLVSHLFRQAEKDAAGIVPKNLVTTGRIKTWSMYLAPVVATWLIVLFLFPLAVEAGLFRLFHPMGAPLPAVFSKIAVTPGDVTLAQGDDLDVIAKVSKDVAGQPGEHAALFMKYPSGQVFSRSMTSTGERQFELNLTDLQQNFSYNVRTDSIESAWFNATVNPRPGIASLDLSYEYPAYTAQPAKRLTGSDGTIEAIAGTKVTLTVHANGGLAESADHKNQLLIDEGKTTQMTVPLVPLSGYDYQASLIVSRSAEYRIQLCNSFGLTNKDDQARNIIAHFDQAPTITIVSPESSVTVRPTDSVQVNYTASDDFGVASIEAIIQADENPAKTHTLRLPAGDHRDIKEQLVLSVANIIAKSGSANINHITYQLKVTDNRDPDPQSAFSAKQTIIIDRHTESFGDKQDDRDVRKMNKIFEQAMQQLQEADRKTAELRNDNPNDQRIEQNRQDAKAAEQHLADAAKELQDQAQQQEDAPLAELAQKAADVANDQIQKAAEDAAKAELAADRPEQRIPDAVAAQEQIAKARDKLQQLRNQIEDARRVAQAQRDLQTAAQLQQEAAEGMEKHPENNNANLQKQRDAMQKLQEAIDRDPALRNDKAREVAQHLAELANRIGELQKQQTRQQAQTAKQEQLAAVQADSDKLADQQQKLNDKVQHFAQQDKQPLAGANAQPPSPDQEKNVIDALKRSDLDNAVAQMRQQADQLNQNAQQLRQQAAAHDPQKTQEQQAAAQQDQQRAQQADQEKNQANQAADEIAQQANQAQAPDANNAAEQHVAQAAQAIEQQADALHPNDANAQKEAQAAHHDAEQAAKDAEKAEHAANADDAKHDLKQASDELHHAAAELAQAANDNAKADQDQASAQDRQAAQAAAEEAKQLAAEQQALVQAADKERPAVARARDNAEPQQQAASEQQQLADQAHQAGDQAAALQQQAQQEADADVAHRAQATHDALQQAAREQQEAAQAEQHGDPAHAAEHQEAAQQDLAEAKADLRGLQEAQQASAAAHPQTPQQDNVPGQDHPPADQGAPDAGQAPNQAQANADQGQPEVSQPDSDPQGAPGQTPEQAGQQAARRAQEASAVQPQALQPDANAAQEAANALAQAAQANAAAHPGHPEQGQENGQEPGKPGQAMDVPMPALVSNEGIAVQNGTASQAPEAVRALGISAGDWARLPALMRNELLNAAQQSGPPTYREMIKNYYVRIAREQAEAGGSNARQQ